MATQAKRRADNKPKYHARKPGMTQTQVKRECELALLQKCRKVIPRWLFLECRLLFKRRAEMLDTEEALYEFDIARRKAVESLVKRREKKEFEFGIDLKDWAAMAAIDIDTWRSKEAEHTAWIIKQLEKKIRPSFLPLFRQKLIACRAFLHDTQCLPDHGGIPDKTMPWLRYCFSDKACETRWPEWSYGIMSALNYIAACRRSANVHGTFEQFVGYRIFEFDIYKTWSKEEIEEEVWSCRDGTISLRLSSEN